MAGDLRCSTLPEDDTPYLSIDGGELIVLCSWGVTTPSAWAGVLIRPLPDRQVRGEVEFRSRLIEVNELGEDVALIDQTVLITEVPSRGESYVLDTHLPRRVPASYCIAVEIRKEAFVAERRSYLTVPERV